MEIDDCIVQWIMSISKRFLKIILQVGNNYLIDK